MVLLEDVFPHIVVITLIQFTIDTIAVLTFLIVLVFISKAHHSGKLSVQSRDQTGSFGNQFLVSSLSIVHLRLSTDHEFKVVTVFLLLLGTCKEEFPGGPPTWRL